MVARRRTRELSPREQLDSAPEPHTWDEIAQMWFGMDLDTFEAAYNRGDFDQHLLEPHVFELALRWGLPARSPPSVAASAAG